MKRSFKYVNGLPLRANRLCKISKKNEIFPPYNEKISFLPPLCGILYRMTYPIRGDRLLQAPF